ncbi:MAG: filamentous hemagglutinin N-terminal domain-containing protein, partial [Proteobacteria bacterium]|nr:filamentous hemagglutinin N-terminal domain-containing protein [Pseudomonadota bacterium]
MKHALRRFICLTLAFLLVFNPVAAAAADGIVVDQKAPAANQPAVSAAPNGVPLVDIARPNSGGLSHNMFDQFNVGEPGVILNNSKKAGRTQLGGVVANNPKLGKGPEARVILNEVTGSSRSRLEGYTEIFGYPADYILANPNGITVNGGGFINTPRATLTTGKPRFDEYGGLSALDVRQGDVLVDGLGLNVSNLDAFDIISRTARINADVHAVKLGISTGYGSHDVATGQFSALAPDGSDVPAVALDSTALGGMYAERIILVGNEKGVGVNLEGVTHATDELVLTADGRIRIKGRVSSDNDVRVASTADSVEISGSLAAAKIAKVTASKDLVVKSEAGTQALLYADDARVSSDSLHNVDGRIESGTNLAVATRCGITNAGAIVSGGNAVLKAGGAVDNTGQMQARGSLDVEGAHVLNSGRMFSIAAVRIHSAGDIVNAGGEILSKKSSSLEATGNISNTGAIQTEGQAFVSAGSLSNEGGRIEATDVMTLDVAGHMANSGTIGTDLGAFISAGSLGNGGGSILSQGYLDFAVAGGLGNSGIIYSGAFSRIRAGSMRNDSAGQVLALGSLALDLSDDLENLGVLNAGESLFVQSGGSVINNDGNILSQTAMELAAEGCITNSGDIQSGGTGLFRAGTLLNEGEILAVGDAVFEIGEDLENTGTLHSGEGLTLTSARLDNSGQILTQGDGAFSVLGDLVNTNFLFSGGATTFSVGGMLHNLRGQILSLGDMVLEGLSAGSRMIELKNDSGTIETLEGSMSIRAKVVKNTNLDFALTPGTQVLSRKGGIYSFFGDNWDQAQDLYRMLPGSSAVSSKRNALIITPAELRALGFGLDRNVIPRSELDAAIAAAEARFALYGGTSGDIAAVSSLKSRVVGRGIYMAVQHYKDRSKVAAYLESITLDEVSGLESGANIAAAVNLDIEAGSFSNHVSRISTASGDISIVADSFENAGQDIFEHRTIEWARAHANEHKSPRLAVEGRGTEVVRTAIDHA